MTADDPIRARLDQIDGLHTAKPDFLLTMGTNYRQMRLALRAVLDTLDYATTDLNADHKRGPTPQRLAHLIRQDIATALQVDT